MEHKTNEEFTQELLTQHKSDTDTFLLLAIMEADKEKYIDDATHSQQVMALVIAKAIHEAAMLKIRSDLFIAAKYSNK